MLKSEKQADCVCTPCRDTTSKECDHKRVGLITGITGQDGSYLAELLLSKGYHVWGIIRRSSDINTHRIDHLYSNKCLTLRYGDLSDSANLCHILADIKERYPSLERLEIYNLGAMSHVKVSFEMPEYTANIDGTGTLRLLEAIRANRLESVTRFYQASTSEMYGKVQEIPQTETTPFYPRSPYGVAKLYGYWITKNYRESYDLFCSNGILYNHETLAGFMPLIFRQNGIIDIKPICEIVQFHTRNDGQSQIVDENKVCYQEGTVDRDLEIWDKTGWTRVTFASGYPHQPKTNNKNPKFIISKNAAYFVTGDHVVIMDDDSEIPAKEIKIGQKVKLIEHPRSETTTLTSHAISETEAELLGMMVASGSVKRPCPLFTNKSKECIDKAIQLWQNVCESNGKSCSYFTSINDSEYQLQLIGFYEFFDKYSIYNFDLTKKIPYQVLNADNAIKVKFLEGYYHIDDTYRTNSATLAQSLIFLLDQITGQNFNINVEFINKGEINYAINLSDDRWFSKSASWILNIVYGITANNTVNEVIEYDDYNGWFYDLTTESGTFHAGLGKGVIHNSPRRGPTFVTRKITRGLAMILRGERDKLVMGNLNAKRDWGHAKTFVRGMWQILQHDKPDDFVLATSEYHTVREFIEKAFALKGFKIAWRGTGINEVGYDIETGRELIVVSENYFRPAEVDELLGDATKARRELGWENDISFDQLVQEMVEADCDGI